MNPDQLRRLLPYATDLQAEVIHLRLEGKSWEKICAITGRNKGNVHASIKSLERRVTNQGYIPEHGLHVPFPEGMTLERATIQRGPEGQIERTWAKSLTDRERYFQILAERIEAGIGMMPRYRPKKPPVKTDDHLATLSVITDFHMGMYAWEAETGEDWDVSIAREVFLDSVSAMISASPKSGLGILCQLGDFLHFDSLLAITPSSGHILDADTRYGKLVDLCMTVMQEAVKMMLARFGKVHVVNAEGNHDIAGSLWLRKHIKHVFAHEPRVYVDDTEFPFYAYLHGTSMLAFHHGHKVKLKELPRVFASEPRYREMWGKAKHTYIHSGHLHHERVIEDGGAISEQHPTLATRDSYSTRLGMVSQRGAKVITYDKDEGEVQRVTVRPRPCR